MSLEWYLLVSVQELQSSWSCPFAIGMWSGNVWIPSLQKCWWCRLPSMRMSCHMTLQVWSRTLFHHTRATYTFYTHRLTAPPQPWWSALVIPEDSSEGLWRRTSFRTSFSYSHWIRCSLPVPSLTYWYVHLTERFKKSHHARTDPTTYLVLQPSCSTATLSLSIPIAGFEEQGKTYCPMCRLMSQTDPLINIPSA